MHVIERTDRFTLVGFDARRGKLTLFDADGPREQGALKHVALRRRLGGRARISSSARAALRRPEGSLGSSSGRVDYDLDHVALWSADPEATAEEYTRFGFEPAGPPARRGRAAPSSSSTRATPATRRGRC